MPSFVRNALIALLLTVVTLAGALVAWLQSPDSPNPLPSASPSAFPSPSPSPTASATPSALPVPTGGVSLFASRGEVVSFEVDPQGVQGAACGSVSGIPATIECFDERTYQVNTPSYVGGATGAVPDPLVPVSVVGARKVWVDVAVPLSAAPGVYSGVVAGKQLVLEIGRYQMPAKLSMPMYVEVESRKIYFAQGLGESSITQAHSDMVKKYHALMRAHRIEPVKHAMSGLYPALKADGTLDLDYLSAVGASHRQLFLTGNIAPPMIFGPANDIPPSVTLLKAIEGAIRSGELPPDTLAWAWDEGWRTLDAQTLARIQLIKANAPSLKVMVTRFDEAQFRPYTDFFMPNIDAFQRPGWPSEVVKPYGLYVSCMAQGKCANGSPVARTGTPLMVLDAPRVDARAFVWIIEKLGAKMGLYFNSTQMLQTAWSNQMNEGGHGDGTLLYPGVVGANGVTSAGPVASIRLKQLRRGMFDMEYIKAAKARGIAVAYPLTDAFTWSKQESEYDAVRVAIGRQL